MLKFPPHHTYVPPLPDWWKHLYVINYTLFLSQECPVRKVTSLRGWFDWMPRWACVLQTKSCWFGQRPQPFVRGVRRHCSYSRARCSYRKAVDANFSYSTPPGKSLFAASHVDSLPESKSYSLFSLGVRWLLAAGIGEPTWKLCSSCVVYPRESVCEWKKDEVQKVIPILDHRKGVRPHKIFAPVIPQGQGSSLEAKGSFLRVNGSSPEVKGTTGKHSFIWKIAGKMFCDVY